MQKSIVLAASDNYKEGVKAFLGSFAEYHPFTDITVYLLDYNLKPDFVSSQTEKYPFLQVIKLKTPFVDQAWACKIQRFQFVQSLPGLVMMADADMFFCANIDRWFDLASQGYIVAGSNGSNVRYTEAWREKYELPIPLQMNYRTITSVPTTLDMAKHSIIWKEIYQHKLQRKQGSDFDLVNIFITLHGKSNDLLVIPSQQVTGVHHTQVKLDTRVKCIDNKLMTTDGLEVFMVHGRFWTKSWLDGLMKPMVKYAKGRTDIIKGAEESRDVMLEEFMKYQD